ncbi:MmcB family DNA repair protein [Pseudoxanthobacter sp. M-2]|uniref:MmcB family DNA repair protein n=1 Tax=Pseudoxanthobacter sp. M-2 TaxID=3078754 RepID=UPI0038FD223B
MSLAAALLTDPPFTDGRQSATALAIRRGARRLLRLHGFQALTEMALPSGRRADLAALGPSGEIWIVEIKSSLADWRADAKWPDYRFHCDRLFFATLPEVAAVAPFPEDAGLILTDGHVAEMVRMAPEHRLAGATRRWLTLRFAHGCARRLHDLEDPLAATLDRDA